MIENWWKAHELEVWIWIAIVGFAGVVGVVQVVSALITARRKKKDDGLL